MRLSQRDIARFWAPLAATWLMMAVEGPFLAAVIARLPDPKFNLAAHGVAFALGIVVEAPVIMLMSAATSLVRDRVSFRKLRNFSHALNAGATALLLLLLVPGIYDALARGLIGLPDEVARLTYGALWFFLPWPAAIGYRRFLQGVLIRSGRTRLVAWGTVIRLMAMSAAALASFFLLDLPGAWVGALSLSVGVLTEAVAARVMVGPTMREVLNTEPDGHDEEMSYRRIAAFYVPLALTSLIGLSVQPLLTFFMGRSINPVESLAVFPVVHALSFFFRAMGLAFQDTAIALMGDRFEHVRELRTFAMTLAAATTGALALVALTPLSRLWFVTISGLTPELTRFALVATRAVVPLPVLSVALSFQRAILVEARRTRPITVASGIEVASIAMLFMALGWGLDWVGATAAFTAFLGGRVAANLYLLAPVRRVLHRTTEPAAAGVGAG